MSTLRTTLGIALGLTVLLTADCFAQPGADLRPAWERYASFGETARSVDAIAFDRRARRSSADTLYTVVDYRLYRIAPGGIRSGPIFDRPGEYLTVTEFGDILTGGHWYLSRSDDGGRTWERNVIEGSVYALLAPTLLAPPGAVFVSTFGPVTNARSFSGGAYGTWEALGTVPGYPLARFHAYGELPPSRSLPAGRLLAATGGIAYSDNGGRTWTNSNTIVPGSPQLVGIEQITAALDSGHPYGGTAYAAGHNYSANGQWSIFASEDAGRTWEARHTFAPGEFGRAFHATTVTLVAAPDGSLFAGVGDSPWTYGADGRMGTVLTSADGGRTWYEFSAGLDGDAITASAIGRDGRLYVGTTNLRVYGSADVWRTQGPVAFPPRDERASSISEPAAPTRRLPRGSPRGTSGTVEVR